MPKRPSRARNKVPSSTEQSGPVFDAGFIAQLEELIHWRRDVRRFRPDPVPAELVNQLLSLSSISPSVGYSQPWRFVLVRDRGVREQIRRNFEACNRAALDGYSDKQAKLYSGLKLAGLDQAPEHLAVFCDSAATTGHGLGRQTMPEMLEYSTVMACSTFWLAARAHGIGVGWVSILEPREVRTVLQLPEHWKLIAYLCVGYPEEEHLDPELERNKWEQYQPPEVLIR